ncbi:MAG: methyltransferase domain-containing protein [Nitrospirota bacterium]|nr:methyltransferase domain-containing protein [Nitrospirota bacterium]
MSDGLNMAAGGCCGPDLSCESAGSDAAGGVSRDQVQSYYGAAAEAPQEQLCCPTAYRPEDVGHIPEEVLAISYGCGSPIAQARPGLGHTVVDLGSGGGIDCFIAARMVGAEGRVIGVDMTEPMLAKARVNARAVADRLGYDVVEFRKGFLEEIPVGDGEANLVTSNCVINLSVDKPGVFSEIHRVLAPEGRFVISDIVSDQPVPEAMRADSELWGECISGALTEREFATLAEGAGFYGITLDREYLWKEVNGIRFYSTTFRAYRGGAKTGCLYQGQTATYLGPGQAFVDDEGHTFLRGQVVEVCTDTAAKLAREPYAGMFALTGPDGSAPSGCC